MKLYVSESPLYEHAILRTKITGQPFDLWVDEFGKTRNTKHNEPRYKVTANGVELDLILHENDDVEIVNDSKTVRKFKYAKQAVDFIKKFSIPLRKQWDQEIDTYELGTVIRLTQKQAMDILDAMSKVELGDY